MDKFTVDLDQVLNDFEYSELTDSTTTKVTDNTLQPVPTQNLTKHSINNVFHSLNEYLSTNIPVNNLEIVDNNINSLEPFYKNNKEEEEEESINNEVKTYSDVNTENTVMLNKYSDFSLTSKDIIGDDEGKNNTNVLNSCEANSSKRSDDLQKNIDDFEQEVSKIPSDTKNIVKYDRSENHIDLQTELQNVAGNNFGVNCENHSLPMTDVEKFKPIIGFEEALHLDDQEINKLLSELEEDDEININLKETQCSTVNDIGCESVNIENNICNESKDMHFSLFFFILI